jgi:hypothetical protein
MMARFHKIFWGLLLVNVVVPLDGHAPWQGLGYILLALGARRLAPVSPRFGRAAALSWAALSWMLVSVWLFDLLGTCDPITGEDKILYPAVHTLLDCLLVWALFGGIKEYALRHASPEPAAEISTRRAAGQSPLWHLPTPQAIALSASRCRAAYVVLVVLASGAAIFQPGTLAVVIATIFLAIWVWMAFDLIHRVRHELVAWDESLREGADPPWQFSLRTLLLAPVAL